MVYRKESKSTAQLDLLSVRWSRRWESFSIAKINKSSIAYAENKRTLILTEIKENRFDYATHSEFEKCKTVQWVGWSRPEQVGFGMR